MTGAAGTPSGSMAVSRWMRKGFIKTGPDLSRDDLATAHWPLTRPPHLLEKPAWCLRGWRRARRNIKRVASAVVEGSIAVPRPSGGTRLSLRPTRRFFLTLDDVVDWPMI